MPNDSLPSGSDVLARICADTRAVVARRKAELSTEAMRAAAAQAGTTRGFGRCLKEATAKGGFGLIAEIKKASPSGGLIRPDFDPAILARAYEAGGATCLSVLTDEKYFQGSPDHLKAARAAVKLPVLRKDFILDEWQVYESRAMGADCVLLIMAALSDTQARDLEALARGLDMDVLVEVHDQRELERALGLETSLIGINNRNLKTLQTDLAITETLAPLIPVDRFVVAESGMRTHADLVRLAGVGAQCFLVGEDPDAPAGRHPGGAPAIGAGGMTGCGNANSSLSRKGRAMGAGYSPSRKGRAMGANSSLFRKGRAMGANSSPSPCGRGMGGGGVRSIPRLGSPPRTTPPPIPLPQGEGEESYSDHLRLSDPCA